MNAHRSILRAFTGQGVAQIDPRHLAAIFAAAQDPGELVPLGEESVADEPEVEGGVLIMKIRGTIVHHETDAFEARGLVSPTEWLIDGLKRAASDPSVRAVVLDIDSGGGMAAGTPEAAEAVYRFRGSGKPIVSVANSSAFSAAYYLAAAAGRLMVTPSGGVGSIGTLVLHEDITRMLEQLGVSVEIIRATKAANKARLNPFEALTDGERAAVIQQLDTINGQFLADVGRFRGLDPTRVAELSELGRTFLAEDAVARGLADGIATLDEVVAELSTLFAPVPQRKAEDPSEVRAFGPEQGAEVRAAEESRRVEGVGVPYGSLSVDMGGWREEFQAGAFGEMGGDIAVLWQHRDDRVLGRRSAGTAGIHDSTTALEYWAHAPRTQWADDALESIRRGDVRGSSFRFRVLPGGQRWERRDGTDVRMVSKAELIEFSPVTFPAYSATNVRVAEQEHRRWVALGRPQGWRGTDRRTVEDFERQAQDRRVALERDASRTALRRAWIPGTDEYYARVAEERGEQLAADLRRQRASERKEAQEVGSDAWHRRAAAFHEASHAVAGLVEGMRFLGFEIHHREPGGGRSFRRDSEPTLRYLAAGLAGERLALARGALAGPHDPYPSAAGDLQKLRAALGGPAVTDAQVQSVVAEAETLLGDHWAAVLEIADALIDLPAGGELSHTEAASILSRMSIPQAEVELPPGTAGAA